MTRPVRNAVAFGAKTFRLADVRPHRVSFATSTFCRISSLKTVGVNGYRGGVTGGATTAPAWQLTNVGSNPAAKGLIAHNGKTRTRAALTKSCRARVAHAEETGSGVTRDFSCVPCVPPNVTGCSRVFHLRHFSRSAPNMLTLSCKNRLHAGLR